MYVYMYVYNTCIYGVCDCVSVYTYVNIHIHKFRKRKHPYMHIQRGEGLYALQNKDRHENSCA
jgi:hypothetical protein